MAFGLAAEGRPDREIAVYLHISRLNFEVL